MDLRQLEIIRAIADTGSFTAAGHKLHVSQSAISRQILLLEEELGESVFHRIGRRIRITPAGRMGQPEDIANVVAFLCSDGAGFVNGVTLPVDGGMSL